MQALQGINTLIKTGQDSKMATNQDQNNQYYAHLVAGLHGAPSANARPIKHGPMPIASTERPFKHSNYSTEDERLKDMVRELTSIGSDT